ncbi:MarR family winged helix-turn-helix transcriptional regulator [Sphingomonas sp. MG17]|uniref:MarR family winged helix-turn-helix transcriptional regulator n=1 Tax=Sphingomonas tagetis TaxID=2949092 RepID=A0A9X2HPB3_9SPHN|nr:MarR family winged helix-turn-helix transcriptional regulator [Sphingomonas tagetis]MCP3731314.1 MarR family winged helix-turn-helix transcriptional regulator [Sphingomonas tagetis]
MPEQRGSDLPEIAQLARRMHRVIGGVLGMELYSAPAWDMLLDLYLRDERKPISLTSLCGASTTAPRTGLNTINRMVARGLLVRSPDPDDGRRIHVRLSEDTTAMLDTCFAELRTLLR